MKRRILSSVSGRCGCGVLCGLAFVTGSQVQAEPIYRCLSASGRPAYVANPTGWSDCRPIDVKVDEPNPDDVERAQEDKRRKEEEARSDEEKAREERLVRAREAEAEAARRRARAAEDEVRLLKQRQAEQYQQDNTPYWPYPIYIPQQPYRPHSRPMVPQPEPPRGGGRVDPFGRPVPPGAR